MTKDWKCQWWLFCFHGHSFLVSRGSARVPGAVCTHSSLRGFRRDTSMVISLGLSPFTTEQMMWYIRSSSPTWSTTSQELCEESSNQTCFLLLCLFIGMISFLTSISTCPADCSPPPHCWKADFGTSCLLRRSNFTRDGKVPAVWLQGHFPQNSKGRQ